MWLRVTCPDATKSADYKYEQLGGDHICEQKGRSLMWTKWKATDMRNSDEVRFEQEGRLHKWAKGTIPEILRTLIWAKETIADASQSSSRSQQDRWLQMWVIVKTRWEQVRRLQMWARMMTTNESKFDYKSCEQKLTNREVSKSGDSICEHERRFHMWSAASNSDVSKR